MLKMKNEKDLNKIKRDYDVKFDEMIRQLKSKELLIRQLNDKNAYVESKTS